MNCWIFFTCCSHVNLYIPCFFFCTGHTIVQITWIWQKISIYYKNVRLFFKGKSLKCKMCAYIYYFSGVDWKTKCGKSSLNLINLTDPLFVQISPSPCFFYSSLHKFKRVSLIVSDTIYSCLVAFSSRLYFLFKLVSNTGYFLRCVMILIQAF